MKPSILQFSPESHIIQYYNSKPSFIDAWTQCERGDWMFCLALKLFIQDNLLLKVKFECVDSLDYFIENKTKLEKFKKVVNSCSNPAYTSSYLVYMDLYDHFNQEETLPLALAAKTESHKFTAGVCRELLTEQVIKAISDK